MGLPYFYSFSEITFARKLVFPFSKESNLWTGNYLKNFQFQDLSDRQGTGKQPPLFKLRHELPGNVTKGLLSSKKRQRADHREEATTGRASRGSDVTLVMESQHRHSYLCIFISVLKMRTIKLQSPLLAQMVVLKKLINLKITQGALLDLHSYFPL